MRLAFALLVLALLAVTAWAVWEDLFPEWRRYQEELVRREIVRREEELARVRADLNRPEIRSELSRIEERLQALAADTTATGGRLEEIRSRLEGTQQEFEVLRGKLREADRALRDPDVQRVVREVTRSLEWVQNAYAAETGTWPPDSLRIESLESARDSLASILAGIEGPSRRLRDRLEETWSRAQELRMEALSLTTTRDSLEAVRTELLAPVRTVESVLARLRNYPRRVREIVSPDGKEVARCPTCHGAMEDPTDVHPPLPAMDVFRDVPCTVCHRGHGRALTVKDAHRGLLAGGGAGEGPYSLRARIGRLRSPDPAEREAAGEELRGITGEDPPSTTGVDMTTVDHDSVVAAAWAQWWDRAEMYFEPGEERGSADEENPLLAVGIDPWIFSARGRPLRYVGSRKCLGCHEVRNREHCRRWRETKFRSMERLAGVEDPERCYPCHTTGYDPATGTFAEAGVTCEACHGPGERYNEMMFVGQELLGHGDELRGNTLIEHGARLAREAITLRMTDGAAGKVNVCVQCHHPRRHREGGPAVLERDNPVAAGERGRESVSGASTE